METQFRGWKREKTVHNHIVLPVSYSNGQYIAGSINDQICWDSSTQFFGKITNVALSGDFLVRYTFQPSELRSWLLRYAVDNPEIAIKLLCEMQGEVIAMSMNKSLSIV